MDPEDPWGPNGFKAKSIPARMLVILAGSLMNFILPVILFSGIFMIDGIEKPVDKPILGIVVENKAAYNAGLEVGDKILTINGAPMQTWNDVVTTLRANGTNEVTLTAERAGAVHTYKMLPEYNEELGRPLIGISPKFIKERVGVVDSIKLGFTSTQSVIVMMVEGLQRIITGKASAEVSGPIGVAQMAGQVAAEGVLPLLNFVAFLSINLGVINLLPLPALDGGHFILLLYEGLRGKPLGAKAMHHIQTIGIAIILAITIFSTFKDITR